MADETKQQNTADVPESEQIFRCWVEVRDLQSGTVRSLALTASRRLHLPTKQHQTQRPDEEVLQLHDNMTVLEAKSLEELATQLRQRYPDGQFERTLHWERDPQAEDRRRHAINALIKMLAKAAFEQLLREQAERQPS